MSENKILYHYTSFDALCKIIGDWSLVHWNAQDKRMTAWATDIRYLNDATEFKYGLDVAKAVYKSLNEENIASGIEESYSVKSFLEHALSGELGSQTYIFSLSENGDLLSQWRAYCPHGGVSIGFSKRVLEGIAEQQRFKLIQCIYRIEDQKREIEQVLRGKTEFR